MITTKAESAEPVPAVETPSGAPVKRRRRSAGDAAAAAPGGAPGLAAAGKPAKRRTAGRATAPIAPPEVTVDCKGKAKAPPKAADPAVSKRAKAVRDSFTFPQDEYVALVALKRRLISLGHPAKKTEVLRAGLLLLAALDEEALLRAARAVPVLATGRPKNGSRD